MENLQMKLTVGNNEMLFQGIVDQIWQIVTNLQKNDFDRKPNMNESNESVGNKNQVLSIGDMDTFTKTTKKKRGGTNNPQIIKNLDLDGKYGKNISLKEFLNAKNPRSNVQITTVIVYYLENILNIDEITINHVFTCYKNAGYRIPNNLVQNLTDSCSSRYGYLTRKNGRFSLSVKGSNLVEFDLPKQKK